MDTADRETQMKNLGSYVGRQVVVHVIDKGVSVKIIGNLCEVVDFNFVKIETVLGNFRCFKFIDIHQAIKDVRAWPEEKVVIFENSLINLNMKWETRREWMCLLLASFNLRPTWEILKKECPDRWGKFWADIVLFYLYVRLKISFSLFS